jgi:hypothetical protein
VAFGFVLLASWGALWLQRGRPWGRLAGRVPRWLGEANIPTTLWATVAYRATRRHRRSCMFGAGMIAGLLRIGAGALKC